SRSSIAEFPGLVGIRGEQRPSLREHEAQPGSRYLRGDHRRDDQASIKSCVDDPGIVSDASEHNAGATTRVRGKGDVGEMEPEEGGNPRGQSAREHAVRS